MRRKLEVTGLIALLLATTSWASASAGGLVAYWTMEEVVTGVVADASGHGHDAKVGGVDAASLEAVPGINGKALKLSADRQTFLSVAKPADFSLSRSITVMAWIKPVGQGKAYEIVCNKGDRSGNPPWPGWRLRYGWTMAFFEYGTADGKEVRCASPEWSVPAGFWSHVAATFDGQTIRVYVNGVEKGSASGAGEILGNQSQLILGNYIGRKDAYAFDGLLDEVKVFDQVLTEEEIFAEAIKEME